MVSIEKLRKITEIYTPNIVINPEFQLSAIKVVKFREKLIYCIFEEGTVDISDQNFGSNKLQKLRRCSSGCNVNILCKSSQGDVTCKRDNEIQPRLCFCVTVITLTLEYMYLWGFSTL